MITIERLKYFAEAADLEHVGDAAKKLHVSPSVISSAISHLEDDLGFNIFNREKNRIFLNENGHKLLEKTKGLLGNLESLYDLNTEDPQVRGNFKIGASPFLMHDKVLPAVTKMLKRHSQFTAEFMSLDTGVALNHILSGALDLAVIFRSIKHSDIEEHALREGKFLIVVRKNHPILKAKNAKRVELLNQLPAITFRSVSGPNLVENHPSFKPAGIVPRHRFFYNDNESSQKLLLATSGWALMPDIVFEKYSRHLQSLSLGSEWSAPYSISLVRRRNQTSTGFFRLLKSELLDELAR